MTNSTEVKQFYNEFTNTRMLQYKLHGNPRIDRAVSLIINYVKSDSKILDIGCGIGIVPEQIAAQLKQGRILACDLAENNIKYARNTIDSDKIEFLNVNVVENFAVISNKLSEPVDLVTIVDVIEHLPPNSYEELFANLSGVSSDRARIILTYPSPEYQIYLQQNEPEELQIIDEVVEINFLIDLARKSGFNLEYFSYIDVWQQNQYIHCVFAKQLPCIPKQQSTLAKIKDKLKRYKSKLLLPYLKAKYSKRFSKNQ
jgi:trans-aconitate 2-methyltransferase